MAEPAVLGRTKRGVCLVGRLPATRNACRVVPPRTPSSGIAWLPVLAAALGYFVDAYDLVLYNIVRVASLKGLGVAPDRLLRTGIDLLNAQLVGMLLGGFVWGIWGDRLGRRSVLFGSILLYSLATAANGWVDSTTAYGVCRFVAGLGLAGELGAGVTLVSELLSPSLRGYATMIVAAVGVMGVCVASLLGDVLPWRAAYFVGGGLGLGLLGLRFGVRESGLFETARLHSVPRGSLWMLFANRERCLRYTRVVLVALPIWFAIGIVVTFAPELAATLGIRGTPSGARAVLFYYLGLTVGDLTTGTLSQRLRTRKRVMVAFVLLLTLLLILLVLLRHCSLGAFYTYLLALGFASGYWAVFITQSAELFGTNLRATVATTAPNLVRGLTVPLALLFRYFAPTLGTLWTVVGLGLIVSSVGLLCLWRLEETYARPLDYLET